MIDIIAMVIFAFAIGFHIGGRAGSAASIDASVADRVAVAE